MSKPKPKPEPQDGLHIEINRDPKGARKAFAGADHDQWNDWLTIRTVTAQPINQKDHAAVNKAAVAVFSGMMDMKPADPIEGILISQLITANQVSLSMYERAWMQPSEYFEARTRYLALADKAARTVVLLTERLDHHRSRGQQKIVVQHVTTNNVTADQAVITDNLVTNKPASKAALEVVTASDAKPMPTLDVTRERDLVGVGGGTKAK
jgi:hypothetical protein